MAYVYKFLYWRFFSSKGSVKMEYVKNQKGIKSLKMDETIWNSITSDKNEVIVGFGSNGRGKSTLKELFRKQNLKKNFSLENEEQINMIFDVFGNYDYLIYSIK